MFYREQGDIPTSVSDDPSEKVKGRFFVFLLFCFFCFFHRRSLLFRSFPVSEIHHTSYFGIKIQGKHNILKTEVASKSF